MISIVMAYYNRLQQLDYTLQTINQSQYKDYEVIVVNDFSEESQNPKELKIKYPDINLRIFDMKDLYPTKSYTNPCIPYNIGFSKIRGDKVIIQNPECCHIGDIISFTENNLTDSNCFSFHCYAANPDETLKIQKQERISFENEWYNHRTRRPAAYHFATSITRQNLKTLNGFDERFSLGIGYDDDEFVFRLKKIVSVNFVETPYVIHQFHKGGSKYHRISSECKPKIEKNSILFKKIKEEESNLVRAWNDGKNIIK